MKNILTSLVLLILSAYSVAGQGIEFFHGTWDEALVKAKSEDKIIFVDAFTTWCGPCKAMSANTFPNPEVGAYFNQHFISMKIDMEKEMGIQFKQKFPVSAYPTLFFIDYDQETVLKVVGSKNPADLIKLGESVTAKYDKSSKYEGAYTAGDRSFKLVYDYITALNKAGKPTVKIANEYLSGQTDLTSVENLKFILEAASQVDCQCFELLEKYKSQMEKITTEDLINDKIRMACANTIKRAIEYESSDLVQIAAEAMKRNIPSEAEFFRSQSNVQYALALNDMSKIEELVEHHVKKFVKNDPAALHQLALDLSKYGAGDQVCRKLAIDLAEKAAKNQDPKFVATYAQLVHKSGAKQEAIDILDEAIQKYEDDLENKDLQSLKALKTKIENS